MNAGGETDTSDYVERIYISQDGLRLYFRDYGRRHPGVTAILCLPGYSRSSKDFHDLARHLSTRRQVLCPDYRGRGRSEYDPDWRNYAPRAELDDLRHLLAATGLHDVVVIGTSYGGILAAAMSVFMPTAIRAVILNDIGPEIDGAPIRSIARHIADDRTFFDWSAAADHLRLTFPDLPAETDDEWLKIARQTYREDDETVRIDWDPAIAKALAPLTRDYRDLWPLFLALRKVPVLAIRGERSEVLTTACFDHMAVQLPGLVRVTVPHVGHAPDLADRKTVEEIDAFLRRI